MFEKNKPLDSVMYLRIRDDEKKYLEDIAAEKNTSPSKIVREALSAWFGSLSVPSVRKKARSPSKRKAGVRKASSRR